MKRIAALTLCLLSMLLCACAASQAKPPTARAASEQTHEIKEPEVPVQTPVRIENVMSVDAQPLDGYLHEGTLYTRLDEAAQALGGVPALPGVDAQGCCRLNLPTTRIFYTMEKTLYDGTHWYADIRPTLTELGYRKLIDPQTGYAYFSKAPNPERVPEGFRVPVLMYHAVSDECWGESSLFVSPKDMEQQLQYLVENGYTPIWFEDLPNVDQYDKPVILTFDDGYDDNYTELFPLLKKYGVKATIFVIAGDLGRNHKMTAEQVTELAQSGLVSIQSHTLTHPNLDMLDEQALHWEYSQSQLELTRLTGKIPTVLCYPVGRESQTAREIAETYYDYGLKMSGPSYRTGGNRYLLYRAFIWRGMGLYDFKWILEYG